MDQKICQSCAMPMTADDYGTNADGTKNDAYCQYCYADGKFTKDETMQEMIDTCVPFMVDPEKGITAAMAREHLEALLPTLKRWQA